MNIRVLALNDDNHDTVFVSENGDIWYYARNFIEHLSTPHNDTYETRGFALVDYDHGPAMDLDDELVDQIFSYLENYSIAPEGYTRAECFEVLWASSNEWWH